MDFFTSIFFEIYFVDYTNKKVKDKTDAILFASVIMDFSIASRNMYLAVIEILIKYSSI
jgi:hypothetical protein